MGNSPEYYSVHRGANDAMSVSLPRPSAGAAAGREPDGSTNSHTVAALLAGMLFLGGIGAVYLVGGSLVARYIHSFGPIQYERKYSAVVLQQEALRHPDLLPLYGTSEVYFDSQYHAKEL